MRSGTERRRRMMVVEPDRLTRWSIDAFFGTEYTVVMAESVEAARALLDRCTVDAVVVADDLPDGGADVVESHARARNSEVRVVRTVTSPARGRRAAHVAHLEKPFQLASLAELLAP